MIWLKRMFPRYGAEWAADQDRLMSLSLALAANGTDEHRGLMMFSVEDDDDLPTTEDVYLGLPSAAFASLFPGYCRTDNVPTEVTSLIAATDTNEFHRMFTIRQYN